MSFADCATAVVVLVIGHDPWQLEEQCQFGIHLWMVLLDHHQIMATTLSNLLGNLALCHACIHRRHRPSQITFGKQVLAGGDLVALGLHLGLSQGHSSPCRTKLTRWVRSPCAEAVRTLLPSIA